MPQAVHFSGSIRAKKCCTVTAPAGHFLAQRPQPMQLTAQPFLAAGPFCVLPQTTRACFLPAGCRLRIPRGQTATHLPQPTQFSLKTLTSPFCTCKPLNSQAVTQSPRPKQLFWQSFCPPNAAAAALGGQKLCQNSCLGLGDCVTACEFNGLQVQNGLVSVLSENCVGCGRCVAVCPRGILSLHPAGKKHARVVCGNTQKGPAAKKGCAVSCIGCGLCAKKCPAGAVTVQHFLARIDPEKCTACGNCVAACPQKVIVLQ